MSAFCWGGCARVSRRKEYRARLRRRVACPPSRRLHSHIEGGALGFRDLLRQERKPRQGYDGGVGQERAAVHGGDVVAAGVAHTKRGGRRCTRHSGGAELRFKHGYGQSLACLDASVMPWWGWMWDPAGLGEVSCGPGQGLHLHLGNRAWRGGGRKMVTADSLRRSSYSSGVWGVGGTARAAWASTGPSASVASARILPNLGPGPWPNRWKGRARTRRPAPAEAGMKASPVAMRPAAAAVARRVREEIIP
jgi:hypothetical protein